MKKILTLLLCILASNAAWAQKDVTLRIHHRLGANAFAFGYVGTNNVGDDFKVDRLEYYISDIVLVHDGGVETPVSQKWILTNAGISQYHDELLGNFNITTLEKIKFSVGVGPDVNHDDPSAWPSNHPLAPKNPSMHWGWNSGYRFVAMEGWAGSNFSQMWQIHALGDNNFFTTEVTTAGFSIGNDLYVAVDADYARAIENITVSTGPITHGDAGEARTLLLNFSNYVFTPSANLVDINDPVAPAVNLYPNPSQGNSQLLVEGNLTPGMIVAVNDLLGRQIAQYALPTDGKLSLQMPQGTYFLRLQAGDELLAVRKWVVTK